MADARAESAAASPKSAPSAAPNDAPDAPSSGRPAVDAPAAPPLAGVLETSLYVADLEASADFYQRLLGSRLLQGDDRMRALEVAGRQVLLLFRRGASEGENPVAGGTVPPHGGDGRLHLAFAVPEAGLAAWEARLTALGISVESRVRGPLGGTSLYFRDPDGHLLELATPGLWPGVY